MERRDEEISRSRIYQKVWEDLFFLTHIFFFRVLFVMDTEKEAGSGGKKET
jgi:hypothetical protein